MQYLTLFITCSFMYVCFTSEGEGGGGENTPSPSQLNFSSTSRMKLIFAQTLISTINFQKETFFAPYFLLRSAFSVIFFNFFKDSEPKFL